MDGNSKPIPSLSAWAGGPAAIESLFAAFYAKVPQHPVLAPVFAGMDVHHAQHVAAFVAEVFGGPKAYTEGGGSHSAMIRKHMGRHLTEVQRRAWVNLMVDTADEVGLASDPEFRAAFMGYLEWGTRLAVINAAEGVAEPQGDPPMPVWGWGPPGGPWLG